MQRCFAFAQQTFVKEYMDCERRLLIPEQIIIPELPLGEQIVAEAMKWVGAPSVKALPEKGREHGMSPEEGFDCSGFVTFVLQRLGLDEPTLRYTNEYCDRYGAFVHEENAKPGDLVCFSKKGRAPTHIGIALDGQMMIDAPGFASTVVGIREWITTPPTETGEGVIYSRNPIALRRAARREGEMADGRWHLL